VRIIFFATYYEPYLQAFYNKSPGLASAPYAVQLERLIGDFFGAFGSYVLECRRQGHDAHLIIANCRTLQRKWALENNAAFSETDWQFSLPLLQTRQLAPDIFFIGSMFQYYGSFLKEIRKYARKIHGWISCPIPNDLFLREHPDLILTSSPHYLDRFKIQGVKSALVEAFFDPTILTRLSAENSQYQPRYDTMDFTFIGGITIAHGKRIAALKRLAAKTPIEFFGYGYESVFRIRIPLINRLIRSAVLKRYRGEIWGVDMYRALAASRITFNAHIDMAEGYGVNMRMYEATGAGALLLTDGKGRRELFTDREVVYYDDIDDAIEKVQYYLNNEQERLKIARAGQKRTLSEYTAEKTVKKMLTYFQQ